MDVKKIVEDMFKNGKAPEGQELSFVEDHYEDFAEAFRDFMDMTKDRKNKTLPEEEMDKIIKNEKIMRNFSDGNSLFEVLLSRYDLSKEQKNYYIETRNPNDRNAFDVSKMMIVLSDNYIFTEKQKLAFLKKYDFSNESKHNNTLMMEWLSYPSGFNLTSKVADYVIEHEDFSKRNLFGASACEMLIMSRPNLSDDQIEKVFERTPFTPLMKKRIQGYFMHSDLDSTQVEYFIEYSAIQQKKLSSKLNKFLTLTDNIRQSNIFQKLKEMTLDVLENRLISKVPEVSGVLKSKISQARQNIEGNEKLQKTGALLKGIITNGLIEERGHIGEFMQDMSIEAKMKKIKESTTLDFYKEVFNIKQQIWQLKESSPLFFEAVSKDFSKKLSSFGQDIENEKFDSEKSKQVLTDFVNEIEAFKSAKQKYHQ